METKLLLLIRKYAQAFVNIFADQINVADVEKINNAAVRLKGLPNLSFFLQLPYIDDTLKKNALEELLITQSGLPESFSKLVELLLTQKRSFLLYPILVKIHELIMEQKNIALFEVTTANELSGKQVETVEKFLAVKSGHIIMCTYLVDKKLIAGLKAQSNTLLWQHSISNYLNTISRSLIG